MPQAKHRCRLCGQTGHRQGTCRSYAAKLIRGLKAQLGSGGLLTGQESHGRSHPCGKAPENLWRVVRMLAVACNYREQL